MSKRWIIAGVALLLLVAVAAQWPAREVAAAAGLERAGVTASGWTGSAWRGTGHDVQWNGVRLGRIQWRLSPISVLTLSPAADVRLEGPEIRAEASLESSLGGGLIEATDVSLEAPAAWLQHVLQQPFLQLGGELVAALDQVRFEDGMLRNLSGVTRWDGAVVRGNIEASLGGVRIDWVDSGEVIVGTVSDSGGPLDANGNVTIEGGRYRVDITLNGPRSNVPLRQALEVLGRPDRSGAVRLVITGAMVPIR